MKNVLCAYLLVRRRTKNIIAHRALEGVALYDLRSAGRTVHSRSSKPVPTKEGERVSGSAARRQRDFVRELGRRGV